MGIHIIQRDTPVSWCPLYNKMEDSYQSAAQSIFADLLREATTSYPDLSENAPAVRDFAMWRFQQRAQDYSPDLLVAIQRMLREHWLPTLPSAQAPYQQPASSTPIAPHTNQYLVQQGHGPGTISEVLLFCANLCQKHHTRLRTRLLSLANDQV